MPQANTPAPGPDACLTRRDLLAGEQALKDALQAFVSFKSHSLYFPPPGQTGQEFEAAYLRGEQKLLLPLFHGGRFLGVFMARGARGVQAKTLPLLTCAASLCLENMMLAKRCRTDGVTGLDNCGSLMAAMEREIELVQACILPGSANCLESQPGEARGGFGLVLLDVDYFSWVNQNYGYLFGERLLAKIGAVLAAEAPEGALCSRLEGDVFAVLLPGASAQRCQDFAETARQAVAAEIFEYPVNGERVRVTVSAGFGLYPGDLHGGQLAAPTGEAARILIQKARKTLSCAKDLGRDQVMSFARILREGGQVLECLPLGRLAVSLGSSADAKEGMRFLVWSPRPGAGQGALRADGRGTGRYPAMVKGEIILMETQDDVSYAEVLSVTDPSWTMEPGDRLLMAQDAEDSSAVGAHSAEPPKRDMASGLLGHRDFIRHLAQVRENQNVFTLALVRLPDAGKDRLGPGAQPVEARVQELAGLCREFFGAAMLGGRFSSGSLILFLAGQDPLALREHFLEFSSLAQARLGFKLSVGLAGYPFLNFGKADVLENCRKALEHSLLITQGPELAVFDSISLTISADRLFTLGDVYGAIEDYKLALLADEANLLARNSLGICLARLGRAAQAKAEFERVLSVEPKNVMALYNLGYVCHRLGEAKQARAAFQRCLKLQPGDVYCLLRLGRMAEEAGKIGNARKYYEKAAQQPKGKGLVMKHLARVALAQGNTEQCREHLHQALVHDPKDAFSLHLLAKLYLDGGEDPGIAEALARQASALRPDQKPFWRELARALEAQGRHDEARQAMGRG